ncbi:SEC-C domain-containing protein [Cytobacillus spongiae]|uniref:SEC-C domain-containing protein n=1 Tax=Cytobacillus spongiae TaxID=2901381 RepID=UPI001F342362|nr:SEC-C domain-containing protein [Cytobacillus spongiae]UII55601.1 SEC-C domain-containing protein [Cytobacillus spongiae]
MKTKVSRNALCPCGSGKKYKRCCGSQETISIHEILENDMIEVQRDIRDFGLAHYSEEIESAYAEFMVDFDIDDEDVYPFIHSFWFICFVEVEERQTILQMYIQSHLNKITRTKLKSIVKSWTYPIVTAGEITDVRDDYLVIHDTLRDTPLKVKLFSYLGRFEEGKYAFAILLPYGEAEYVLFPNIFDIEGENCKAYADVILQEYRNASVIEVDDFLADHLLWLMLLTPQVKMELKVEQVEWPSSASKDVAEIFEEEMKEAGEDYATIEMGVILWYQFVTRKNKRIQNPLIYVAALRYFVSTIIETEGVYTQKELAKKYGISVSSVSSRYGELYDELEPELAKLLNEEVPESHMVSPFHDLLEELKDHEFDSMEEAKAYIYSKINGNEKKTGKQTDEQKAQDLIYEAIKAGGKKRYQLAQEALALNPLHPDGYTLLAEQASTMEDALLLYQKGMECGIEALGEDFFSENRGFFWGLIETRPYMRARYNYAQTLHNLGNMKDAITEYEGMIELNPEDNQGVRDLLLIAYIEVSDLKGAKRLMERFEEDSSMAAFNKVLLEIMNKGFTAKGRLLLNNAKSQNPHVIPYLVGKKKLPQELPAYYGIGDENEAKTYALLHQHLWNQVSGMKQWLLK